MDRNYLPSYILQERFNMNDDKGKKILVTIPKTNEKVFDLSKVILQPKYLQDIKLDKSKLKDLVELAKYIRDGEDKWIHDLKKRQMKLKKT